MLRDPYTHYTFGSGVACSEFRVSEEIEDDQIWIAFSRVDTK
jgi:hypothetical protein